MLKEHLKEIGIPNNQVLSVSQLQSKNPKQSSFCVTVVSKDTEAVIFLPENWPKGVEIRPMPLVRDLTQIQISTPIQDSSVASPIWENLDIDQLIIEGGSDQSITQKEPKRIGTTEITMTTIEQMITIIFIPGIDQTWIMI